MKKPTELRDTILVNSLDEEALTMSGILGRRKRRRVETDHPYIIIDFIVGSSAEIEHLFSIVGRIIAHHRQNMTPLLFGALVLLKLNRGYWDFCTVITAMGNHQSSQVRDRVLEDSEQQMLTKCEV